MDVWEENKLGVQSHPESTKRQSKLVLAKWWKRGLGVTCPSANLLRVVICWFVFINKYRTGLPLCWQSSCILYKGRKKKILNLIASKVTPDWASKVAPHWIFLKKIKSIGWKSKSNTKPSKVPVGNQKWMETLNLLYPSGWLGWNFCQITSDDEPEVHFHMTSQVLNAQTYMSGLVVNNTTLKCTNILHTKGQEVGLHYQKKVWLKVILVKCPKSPRGVQSHPGLRYQ